jgi:hypothetical protein
VNLLIKDFWRGKQVNVCTWQFWVNIIKIVGLVSALISTQTVADAGAYGCLLPLRKGGLKYI